MHHVLESAGGVGAVLAGQAAVLFVDELQLGQTLLDLPLEGLQVKGNSVNNVKSDLRTYFLGFSREVDENKLCRRVSKKRRANTYLHVHGD